MELYKDLLIINIENDMAGKYFRRVGENIVPIWKKDHYSSRKYKILSWIGMQYLLYGFTKHDVQNVDKIILSETVHAAKMVDYIRRYNYKCRIVFWFWNPVREYMISEIVELKKRGVKVYSFDEDDCKKYDLLFNNNMVAKFGGCRRNMKPEFDIFFIGKDKGRYNKISDLANVLTKLGKSIKFTVVGDKKKKYIEVEHVHVIKKNLEYEEIVYDIWKSKCIVDIVQDGQSGLTWRPFEALYYGKKLITNNKNILKYDFYNPSNIYILDSDKIDEDDLDAFLNRAFEPWSKDIVEKYNIETWINHFFD